MRKTSKNLKKKRVNKTVAQQLDQLLHELVQSLPAKMEAQIYLDRDGYNTVLISKQGGSEDHANVVDLMKRAKDYEAEETEPTP